MNASAFGKAHRKKTTVVFVAIPAMEADSHLAVSRPKRPSDHFGGSGDYPLATVSGRCQLLRLDKPPPENSLRSDIQGAWLIFALSWHAPSQLLLEGNPPTRQNDPMVFLGGKRRDSCLLPGQELQQTQGLGFCGGFAERRGIHSGFDALPSSAHPMGQSASSEPPK